MTNGFTTSNIKQVLTYPFKDPKWVGKCLIGLAMAVGGCIIPILPGLILMGYFYQIMDRVLNENGDPYLPEWADFGKMLSDGWRLFCVYFLYMLPGFLAMTVGMAAYFGSVIYMASQDANTVNPAMGLVVLGCMGIMMLCMMVSMVLMMAAFLILPPALCHTVKKGKFSAGFAIGEWWQVLKANFGGFMIALLIVMGMFTAIYMLSMIFYMTLVLFCLMYVVALVGGFYIGLVFYGLFPLVYREGLEKMNPPTAVEAVA